LVLTQFGRVLSSNIRDAILIRNQQIISSLPPSSPQGVIYEYDTQLDTYVATRSAGATAFPSPETLAPQRLAVRADLSYFSLRPLQKRTTYFINVDLSALGDQVPRFIQGSTKYGVSASARTTILSLAASYGVTDAIEVELTAPITWVSATAGFEYLASPAGKCSNSSVFALVGGPYSDVCLDDTPSVLDRRIASGDAVFKHGPLSNLGINGLGGETNLGLGRVGAGVKARLFHSRGVDVALLGTLLFPSPSQAELAGTNTWALYPQLISSLGIADDIRALATVGYNADMTLNELRSFAWSSGVSWNVTPSLSVDVGLSGSLYNEGLKVFSEHGKASADLGGDFAGQTLDISYQTLDAERLARNFVDAVVGIKYGITDHLRISGTTTVPIVNVEFRPYAVGAIALEADL
jgi:hypothetical protein